MAKKQGKNYVPEDVVHQDLNEMDMLLRQLRAEYNQFFVGASKIPPTFKEQKIKKIIKKYQGGDLIKKPTDRFRYFNFTAKLNANLELWARKMRKMEGENVFGRQQAPPDETSGVPGASSLPQDTPKAYRYSAITRDPTADKATVDNLYANFQRANKLVGKDKSNLPREKFQAFLKKQADVVKQSKGTDAVKFTLKVVDGDVKLTVKPAK